MLMDTSGLDSLIRDMERLGQESGPVAEEMLNTAAGIIRDQWRAVAQEHGHIDTGAMIDAIGYGPTTHASAMLYRDVYPLGTDAKGVRNAEKAFILHYGRSNMPGDYWVDEAEMRATPETLEACREIWDRFLKGGH